jgi:hypothetical protein
MRKKKVSRDPMGKATPKRREKIKKEDTDIPAARKRAKARFLGLKAKNIKKDTTKVVIRNFKVSRINGNRIAHAVMPRMAT